MLIANQQKTRYF